MTAASNKPVRVRFAPSPTGPLHIGGVRTALFNWLFARKNGGASILRIEDTDKDRSEKKYESEIFEGLRWLGLGWDEGPETENGKWKMENVIKEPGTMNHEPKNGPYGPYRQSERTEIYRKYLEKLLNEKKAYYCYCTKDELEAERQAMLAQGLPPKYGGHCRNLTGPPAGKPLQVIRFRTPEVNVEFKDIIRGKVSFDAALFGDIAIAKDLDAPLYNFAVVVDDALMEVSHVIRGEEHLSNTPRQILFQRALGFSAPEYAHLPLILNPDRSKMSKRFSDTALSGYKNRGYLPEAIVNFLAFLGWHPQDDRELLSLDELAKAFDLRRVQKAGAVFNQEKLDWLQKEYLKQMSVDEIANRLAPLLRENKIAAPVEFIRKVIGVERTRLTTLNDFLGVAGFFFKLAEYDAQLLIWQRQESRAKTKEILEACADVIDKEKSFDRESLSLALGGLVDREGRGAILWPLRVALSGLAASPDPLEIMEVLGKKESLIRMQIAITKLDTLG